MWWGIAFLASVAAEDCKLRVAHCIVGHVRSFWQRAVYQSIANVLVAGASPKRCADFFYVLGTHSSLETAKGGVYEYNETLLWNSAWKVLPPTKYLLDPPPPSAPHASYYQPDCLFQCIHMFDKAKLCLDLVKSYEQETGKRYAWIVRSRPDLLWSHHTVLPPLHRLSHRQVYAPNWRHSNICTDTVQIVPRKLADVFFGRITDKCMLRRELDQSMPIWNCDTWIYRFSDSQNITVVLLKLVARIRRLESIRDNFFDYHDQWTQHVRFAEQLLQDSVYVLGNEDLGAQSESRSRGWSDFTTSLPASLEPREGCSTVADSQFCAPTNAYLIHLRFAMNVSVLRQMKHITFGLWRSHPRDLENPGSANSHFRRNASRFFFRRWFPAVDVRLISEPDVVEAPFHYNLWTPVLLRRGDCLFWTSCAGREARRFQDTRRHLSRDSRVLSFLSNRLPKGPRMSGGYFHAVQPRHHSAAFTFIKQLPIL